MKNQKILFVIFLSLILLPISTNLSISEDSEEVNIVFSVNFFSFSPSVISPWGLIMELNLPKIGMGVDFHNSTLREYIALRTWNYPIGIEYDHVPTYEEGGYDILFNRFYWDLDPDIIGKFDALTLSNFPNPNFYQYVNPEYDEKLTQYMSEFNQTLKDYYFQELQGILYEDQPAIGVIYGKELYGRRTTIMGVDWDLLCDSSHRPELWNDTDDQIITYAIGGDLDVPSAFLLDKYPSHQSLDNSDAKWMNAVYGKLFQREQTTHYWEPEIALDFSISSDLRNYTIYIDPNAKFSDGSQVLAEDIQYSYELLMTPSVNSPEYNKLLNWFSTNQSIEIVDTQTINFNFSKYCYKPLQVLSEGIIDKSDVEPLIAAHGYSIFSEAPLSANVRDSLVKSCGPFKLELYEPMNNQKIKMVPNIYWNNLTSSGGNNPFLKEYYHTYIRSKDATVAALADNLVDIVDCFYWSTQEDYKNNPDIQYVLAKSGFIDDMSINMRHPIIGTGELTPVGTPEAAKLIRKAISHAVPRAALVEHRFHGLATPGTSVIGDICVGYNKSLEPYSYDLEQAIEYMEQAGYGVRITTPIKTSFTSLLMMTIGLTTIIGIRKRNR